MDRPDWRVATPGKSVSSSAFGSLAVFDSDSEVDGGVIQRLSGFLSIQVSIFPDRIQKGMGKCRRSGKAFREPVVESGAG
jgi:hypothetical protein